MMSCEIKQVDVILIGAGVVGMSCALALKASGFSVCLIEKNNLSKKLSFKQDYDQRVYALNEASMNLFAHLNLSSKIEAYRSAPYQNMQIFDAQTDSPFTLQDTSREPMGFILEHQVLMLSLFEALSEQAIPLIEDAQIDKIVSKTGEIGLKSGERFQAKVIVGADGAHSWLRNKLNLDIDKKPYHQQAIVATLKAQKPHQQTAYQWFHPSGPLAFLPLKGDYDLSLVWSCSDQQAQHWADVAPQAFESALTQHSSSMLGQIRLESARQCFPLVKQHASQYYKDRCVLIGDAAHVIHPLAGLGMNLGLMDAALLVQRLQAWKASGEIKLVRQLQSYQRHRKAHNVIVMRLMDLFYHGFASQNLGLVTLRHVGLKFLNRYDLLKKYFIDFGSGRMGYTIPDLGKKDHGIGTAAINGTQNPFLS